MKATRVVMTILCACAFLALTLQTSAQFPGMQGPPSMRGVWSPVVGSGGAYSVVDRKGEKTDMEIAVVGTETYQGATGHWLEFAIQSKKGPMIMKQFLAVRNKEVPILRMIFQQPGDEPIEMSMEMMGMMNRGAQREAQKSDFRETATKVGSETITVPAGTFVCDHYRTTDGDEFWISDKVSPWGLVKTTGKDHSMTLTRVITNARTKITGTPRKFDMGEMMRRPS